MTRATPGDDEAHGPELGNYVLVRRLGVGASSSVFEARHKKLQRRVAIKVLHEHLAADPKIVARFLREGRIAAVVRHPNVVDVLDVGEVEGVPYLVMELLDGVDLGTWLRAHGRLPVADALRTILPLAAALQIAHEFGALHRDLKPSNVMLSRDGRGTETPKLVDFGLSKRTVGHSHVQLTAEATVIGTLGYIAPEQLVDAARVDARSDQFGLGATLYHCLAGRMPHEERTIWELDEALRSPPPPPSRFSPDVPSGLDAVVLRALAFEPSDRHVDVAAFGRALLPFAEPDVRALHARDFATRARPDVLRVPADSPTLDIADAAASPAKTAVVAPTIDATREELERPGRPASPERQAHPVLRKLPVPPGKSPFHIKGLSYRGMRRAIDKRVPGGIDAFCALLDDDLASFARQTFLPSGFYDALPMVPLSQALAFSLGVPLERFIGESNEAQARYDLSGVHKALLSGITDADFPARMQRSLRRHYDFVELTHLESSKGRVLSRVIGQPVFFAVWFVPALTSYLTALARAAGLRRPHVSATAVIAEGQRDGIALGRFDLDLRYDASD